MTIQGLINSINSTKKQKVFLIGNTFLLLFVLLMFIFNVFTSKLNIVLCPMKNLANIPCPFCGGTRCAVSFFNIDFKSSFMYHPATFVLIIYAIIVELVFIFDIIFKKDIVSKIFKMDNVIRVYLIAVAIQYIIRLVFIFNNIECPIMFTNI